MGRMHQNAYLFSRSDVYKAKRIIELERRPIVIGGCGRSGTTLLLSLLSCHPHILAIEEETRAFCRDGYKRPPLLDSPFKLKRLYKYLLKREIPTECTRWCEKTPRNVLYYERLLQFFGERLKILNIVRDGRDVVTSRHPSNPNIYWISPQRWLMDTHAGKKFADHPQVLTLRYEDLILNYLPTMKRICTFLQEEWVEQFELYTLSSSIKKNVAWFGGVRALSKSSIGRWKQAKFKHQVNSLLELEGAQYLLENYGYLEKNI